MEEMEISSWLTLDALKKKADVAETVGNLQTGHSMSVFCQIEDDYLELVYTDATANSLRRYEDKDEFEEAIEAFDRSLELKPDDSFTVINIANCYQAMGRFDDGERFVLDYLARGFKDSQLLFLLGNLKVHQGQPDKAIPYFERTLEENPRSASAHNALGAVYVNRDGGAADLARAEEHLLAASAINPTLMSVRYNLAQVREKQGRLDQAADLYLQEVRDLPKSYKALYNLSRVYRLMGREDEEYETLKRTIEVEPDFPIAYFYLARVHLRRGAGYEEAIGWVRKAIELKPAPADLPLGYFLLADLYNRVGDQARSEENARLGQAAAEAAKAKAKS